MGVEGGGLVQLGLHNTKPVEGCICRIEVPKSIGIHAANRG